jgi:hypothetical protein
MGDYTHGQGVNHGLEAEVDLAGADDLGDILKTVSFPVACSAMS